MGEVSTEAERASDILETLAELAGAEVKLPDYVSCLFGDEKSSANVIAATHKLLGDDTFWQELPAKIKFGKVWTAELKEEMAFVGKELGTEFNNKNASFHTANIRQELGLLVGF